MISGAKCKSIETGHVAPGKTLWDQSTHCIAPSLLITRKLCFRLVLWKWLGYLHEGKYKMRVIYGLLTIYAFFYILYKRTYTNWYIKVKRTLVRYSTFSFFLTNFKDIHLFIQIPEFRIHEVTNTSRFQGGNVRFFLFNSEQPLKKFKNSLDLLLKRNKL